MDKRGLFAKIIFAVALFSFVGQAIAGTGVIPIQEVFEPDPALYPEKDFAKVAVVQWAPDRPTPLGVSQSDAELFKLEQRKIIEAYIREAAAKGAKLVVTPEFSIVGYPDIPELPPAEDEYRNSDDIRPYVETVPGPTTDYFSMLAKDLGIYIHIGFAEVDNFDGVFYNVVVAIDPMGHIVAEYRKMNLYQAENNFLSPGFVPVSYEAPWGKVALAICADIYSYLPMAQYRLDAVNVVALSTSWAHYNTGFFEFSKAALLGGFTVVAANQIYFPDSGVINPDGSAQSHIRQSTGVAYGYLKYSQNWKQYRDSKK